MNKFSGKAIYCPTGKAGEYATYACNFLLGVPTVANIVI